MINKLVLYRTKAYRPLSANWLVDWKWYYIAAVYTDGPKIAKQFDLGTESLKDVEDWSKKYAKRNGLRYERGFSPTQKK